VRRAAALLLALSACALVPGACGGDGKKDGDRSRRGGAARNVDPVPDESVDDAIDRTEGAVTAEGCEAVMGLLHYSYGEPSKEACEAVKAQVDGFRDARGRAFKTGAVIDYQTSGGRHRVIALALDPDRTYKIAFVADVPEATLRTDKPAAFDRNAQAAVAAMRAGNCDTFLPLVSRTEGLGVGPDQEVCTRVSDIPWRRELLTNRGARPVALGGNGWLAFYKLRTAPDAYYTLIMARAQAPGGAPRYVLVNAFPAL
jgi:hypothetical protein